MAKDVNKKFTINLDISTEDAEKQVKVAAGNIKKMLADMGNAADKMTMLKDVVGYVAQIDQALAALQAKGGSFSHMFDGMDADLKKVLESIFGVTGESMTALEQLKAKVAAAKNDGTLTGDTLKGLEKEVKGLYGALNMLDKAGISGKGKDETRIAKLESALENFAVVFDGVKKKIKDGLGFGGTGEGDEILPYLKDQNNKIQQEIKTLEDAAKKYKNILSIFNGEELTQDTNIKSSVAELEELRKTYLNLVKEANDLKWFKGESSDEYKQKAKEMIHAAAALKGAMDYANKYGSSSSQMWVMQAKDSGGEDLLDSITKYLDGIKNSSIFKELHSYVEQQVDQINQKIASLKIGPVDSGAAQVNSTIANNKKAADSYDKLYQSVDEYIKLQKKLSTLQKGTDEYKNVSKQQQTLQSEILSMKDLRSDQLDDAYGIIDEMDEDLLTTSEAVEKFCNIFKIEIPESIKAAMAQMKAFFQAGEMLGNLNTISPDNADALVKSLEHLRAGLMDLANQGKLTASDMEQINFVFDSAVDHINNIKSPGTAATTSMAGAVQNNTNTTVTALDAGKKKIVAAFKDYYNAASRAQKEGYNLEYDETSTNMDKAYALVDKMLNKWGAKAANAKVDVKYELDYVKDSIIDGLIGADKFSIDDIEALVDKIFADHGITFSVPVEEILIDASAAKVDTNKVESAAQESSQEIAAGMNKAEGEVKDVTGAFEDLVNYISKSGQSPKTFFQSLASGAVDLDDELKNILKSLNLIDDAGKVKISATQSGSNNAGGMISDQYALIARPIGPNGEKLKFAKESQPKLLEAEKMGASVGTILEVFEDKANGIIYELQKTVPGTTLAGQDHKIISQDFLSASEDQIKKMLYGFVALQKNNLWVDQNSKNILYDKDKGFSFIDLFSASIPGITASASNTLKENVDKMLDHLFVNNHNIMASDVGQKFIAKVYDLMNVVLNEMSAGAAMPTDVVADAASGADSAVNDVNNVVKAFQDLSHYIATSTNGPKDFFNKLSSGAIQADGELKNVLTTLNMIDESGNINFKPAVGGLSNKGTLISNDYVLIARETGYNDEKLGFSQDIMPRTIAAKNAGANIGAILDVYQDELNKNIFYELQSVVSGKSILAHGGGKINTDFLNATDEQIKKLISDLMTLKDNDLWVDWNGNNILYDKDKGFSLIDFFAASVPGLTVGKDNTVKENLDMFFNMAMGQFGGDALKNSSFMQHVYDLADQAINEVQQVTAPGDQNSAVQHAQNTKAIQQETDAQNQLNAAKVAGANIADNTSNEAAQHLQNAQAIQQETDAQDALNQSKLTYNDVDSKLVNIAMQDATSTEAASKMFNLGIELNQVDMNPKTADVQSILTLIQQIETQYGTNLDFVKDYLNQIYGDLVTQQAGLGSSTTVNITDAAASSTDALAASIQIEEVAHAENTDQINAENAALQANIELKKKAQSMTWNQFATDESLSGLKQVSGMTSLSQLHDFWKQSNYGKKVDFYEIKSSAAANETDPKMAAQITEQEVNQKIADLLGKTGQKWVKQWYGWQQDFSKKTLIEDLVLSNPELYNAAINKAWHIHQKKNKVKIPFEEFLKTPIEMFRQDNHPIIFGPDETLSFSIGAPNAGYGKAESIVVKPIDTLGNVSTEYDEETETFVPSYLLPVSDDSLYIKNSAQSFDDFYAQLSDKHKKGLDKQLFENEKQRVANILADSLGMSETALRSMVDNALPLLGIGDTLNNFNQGVIPDLLDSATGDTYGDQFADVYNAMSEIQKKMLAYYTSMQASVKHMGAITDFDALSKAGYINVMMHDPTGVQKHTNQLTGESKFQIFNSQVQDVQQTTQAVQQETHAHQQNEQAIQQEAQAQQKLNSLKQQANGIKDELWDAAVDSDGLESKSLDTLWHAINGVKNTEQSEIENGLWANDQTGELKDITEIFNLAEFVEAVYGQSMDHVKNWLKQVYSNVDFNKKTDDPDFDYITDSLDNLADESWMSSLATKGEAINNISDSIANIKEASKSDLAQGVYDGLNGNKASVTELFQTIEQIEQQYGENLDFVKDCLKQVYKNIDFDNIVKPADSIDVPYDIDYDIMQDKLTALATNSIAEDAKGVKFDALQNLKTYLANIKHADADEIANNKFSQFGTSETYSLEDVIGVIKTIETTYGENLDYVLNYLKQILPNMDVDALYNAPDSVGAMNFSDVKTKVEDFAMDAYKANDTDKFMALTELISHLGDVNDTDNISLAKGVYYDSEYGDEFQIHNLLDMVQDIEAAYGENLEFVKNYLKNVASNIPSPEMVIPDDVLLFEDEDDDKPDADSLDEWEYDYHQAQAQKKQYTVADFEKAYLAESVESQAAIDDLALFNQRYEELYALTQTKPIDIAFPEFPTPSEIKEVVAAFNAYKDKQGELHQLLQKPEGNEEKIQQLQAEVVGLQNQLRGAKLGDGVDASEYESKYGLNQIDAMRLKNLVDSPYDINNIIDNLQSASEQKINALSDSMKAMLDDGDDDVVQEFLSQHAQLIKDTKANLAAADVADQTDANITEKEKQLQTEKAITAEKQQQAVIENQQTAQTVADTAQAQQVQAETAALNELLLKVNAVEQAVQAKTAAFKAEGITVDETVNKEIVALTQLKTLLDNIQNTLQLVFAANNYSFGDINATQDKTSSNALPNILQTIQSTLEQIYGVLKGFTGIEADNKNSVKYKEPAVETNVVDSDGYKLLASKMPEDVATETTLTAIRSAVDQLVKSPDKEEDTDLTKLVEALNSAVAELKNVANGIVQHQKAAKSDTSVANARISDKTSYAQIRDVALNSLGNKALESEVTEMKALANGVVQVTGWLKVAEDAWEGFTVQINEANEASKLAFSTNSKAAKAAAAQAKKLEQSSDEDDDTNPKKYTKEETEALAQEKVAEYTKQGKIATVQVKDSGRYTVTILEKTAGLTKQIFQTFDENNAMIERTTATMSNNYLAKVQELQNFAQYGFDNKLLGDGIGETMYQSFKKASDELEAMNIAYSQVGNLSKDQIAQWEAQIKIVTQLGNQIQKLIIQNQNPAVKYKVNKKAYGATPLVNAQAKFHTLSSRAQPYIDEGSTVVSDALSKYETSLKNLIALQDKFNNGQEPTKDQQIQFVQLKDACNAYQKELKKLLDTSDKFMSEGDELRRVMGDIDVDSRTSRGEALQAYVQEVYGAQAAIGKFNGDMTELQFTIKNTDGTITNMSAAFNSAKTHIGSLRGETKKATTIFDELGSKFKELWRYAAARMGVDELIQAVRKGVQYVREIDNALTDLKKVTDETDATYDKFLQTMSKTADKVGSTVADLTTMAGEWARLGYTLEEAGMLAESTAILLNVSEFDDATTASEALISTMQAFGYAADESQHVVDILNEVGLKMPRLYSNI